MYIMKIRSILFPVLAGALMLSSCASKKEFEALKAENAELKLQNQDTRINLAECNANSKNLQDRLAEEQRRVADLRKDYQTLQGSLDKSLQQNNQGNINISKLVDEINASNRFIKQLVEAKTKSDSLNMVLTNNLTRSLNRDELQEVDVQVLKGVVYISLADNMLYKSGSYEVNDRAEQTLSKIAKIITDYRDYDVLIEGNTDNVPINAQSEKMKTPCPFLAPISATTGTSPASAPPALYRHSRISMV